jgi:hypothetical protein
MRDHDRYNLKGEIYCIYLYITTRETHKLTAREKRQNLRFHYFFLVQIVSLDKLTENPKESTLLLYKRLGKY